MSKQLSHSNSVHLQASIISIAKRSTQYVPASSSTDAHTVVTIGSSEEVEVPWHAVETAEEVVEELVSSTKLGLTQAEADRRWGNLQQQL